MNCRVLLLGIVFLSLWLPSLSQADKDLAIGLGYPFLSVKYSVSNAISTEFKIASSEGIHVVAARGYWNAINSEKFNAFAGLEAGGIFFDTMDLQGSGLEYGVLVGGEHKIIPELGVSLDIAPSMIHLNASDISHYGFDWIVSAAIYWYVF